MRWKDKLVLADGEQVKHESSRSVGFMGEDDIETYSILDKDGVKVGTVKVVDHTAVRGLRRTVHIEQRDLDGRLVTGDRFTPD